MGQVKKIVNLSFSASIIQLLTFSVRYLGINVQKVYAQCVNKQILLLNLFLLPL